MLLLLLLLLLLVVVMLQLTLILRLVLLPHLQPRAAGRLLPRLAAPLQPAVT